MLRVGQFSTRDLATISANIWASMISNRPRVLHVGSHTIPRICLTTALMATGKQDLAERVTKTLLGTELPLETLKSMINSLDKKERENFVKTFLACVLTSPPPLSDGGLGVLRDLGLTRQVKEVLSNPKFLQEIQEIADMAHDLVPKFVVKWDRSTRAFQYYFTAGVRRTTQINLDLAKREFT